jgi:hypothetical protein
MTEAVAGMIGGTSREWECTRPRASRYPLGGGRHRRHWVATPPSAKRSLSAHPRLAGDHSATRSYGRPKRVQRSSRDSRVALDSPAVRPAEDDDCKWSIPGCCRSATLFGVAFGRSYEQGRFPDREANRGSRNPWRVPVSGFHDQRQPSAAGISPPAGALHSSASVTCGCD